MGDWQRREWIRAQLGIQSQAFDEGSETTAMVSQSMVYKRAEEPIDLLAVQRIIGPGIPLWAVPAGRRTAIRQG